MASAVTIRRQLAPTVGPGAAAAGIKFRAGLNTSAGGRVASGLVLRFGAFDCVSDNVASFADGAFPEGGSIISFGDHRVYAAVIPEEYPSKVLTFPDSLSIESSCSSGSGSHACVEVMMASTGDRSRRPPLERATTEAGTSHPAPTPSALEAAVQDLLTPVTLSADPATVAAELETARQRILDDAIKVNTAQRQLEATL